MSQTFLEKYTVAPAPSRDYYGLKIQEDEVKLFHWPIHQRPHKPPITRAASFSNWRRDTILQSEIEQIFGNSWVEYTNDIIDNRKSLLTLPSKIIKNILAFLPAKDISQLFLLSRAFHEILNNEEIWELIFKKIKGPDLHRAQRRYGMSYGWKQLLKETQDIKIAPKPLRLKKPELEIKKVSSKKPASNSLTLQNLKFNVENTFDEKPKLLPKNPRELKSIEVSSDDKLENNAKSVNILTLQSADVTSKPKKSEPEKRKNFRASPAPKSTYQSGRTAEKILKSKVQSRRKVSSPSISSLSSLKTKEPCLENLVKKSLSDFKQSKDPFLDFEWLTGSPDDPGDDQTPLDTKWITKAEKLKDEYGFTDWDKKSSPISELKPKKSIFKESKICSTEDLGLNCGSRSSKTSVCCQSTGETGLRINSGFNLLNSEFIKQGLDLQPKMRGAHYSDIGGKLKNYRMK